MCCPGQAQQPSRLPRAQPKHVLDVHKIKHKVVAAAYTIGGVDWVSSPSPALLSQPEPRGRSLVRLLWWQAALFKRYDVNRSGGLDVHEFSKGLRSTHTECRYQRVPKGATRQCEVCGCA